MFGVCTCPFCGSGNRELVDLSNRKTQKFQMYIRCCNCGGKGGTSIGSDEDKVRKHAIMIWNMREGKRRNCK